MLTLRGQRAPLQSAYETVPSAESALSPTVSFVLYILTLVIILLYLVSYYINKSVKKQVQKES